MKRHFLCLFFISFAFLHFALAQSHRIITKDSVEYQLNDETNEAIIIGAKFGTRLKKVVFPNKIRVEENEYSVVELRFFRSKDLEELTIPETVKRIGKLALSSCNKLRCITLPSNAPTVWFRQDAFQRVNFDELKFSAPPENFIQRGKLLYSKSQKTIYDVRFRQDTIFFVPKGVDSVYFHLKNWPSPYHIVLHKNLKYLNDDSNRSRWHRRHYLAVPVDEPTSVFQYYGEGKIVSSWISFNLANHSISLLPKKQRELLRGAQYKESEPFLLDFEKDSGVDSVVFDYIYSKTPDSRNRHVAIHENKQETLTPLYVPIRVRAFPKEGKRIVGYVYFNDTIAGDTCTIYSCFKQQRLSVMSADCEALVAGVDYSLSSDKRTLHKWSVNMPLIDLRSVAELANVQKLASYSLHLNKACRELFLPKKLETIDADCLNAATTLELLAYPASMKTLHLTAWQELCSLERVYIQGEAPIDRTELEKVYSSPSSHIQQLLVDAEVLPFWKEKLANSSLLSLLKGVERETQIINTEPDKIVTTVYRLDTHEEFQLDAQNSTISLPRTTPIKISIRPLLSYDLRRMQLNNKLLETARIETFLLDTLRVSSQGETVRFRVNILPCAGGKITVKRLDGSELETNSELLRGTQLKVTVTPTPPFLFKHWTFNGQISRSLDTLLEVRQHILLSASFYRRKPLMSLNGVDRRCKLTLLDVQAKARFFDELFEGDTIYLQPPNIPQGLEINTFELNGELITQFPYKLVVASSLTLKVTLIPKLCKITLSEAAAKYLELSDENGTPLPLAAPLPYNTKFVLNFRGKKSERLVKLLVNTEPYTIPTFPFESFLKDDLNIDVEVTTLFNTLYVELPPSCTLTINGDEIKHSTSYRAEHGAQLTIRANSGEAYTITALQLDGSLPIQSHELVFELLQNSRLTVLATPNPVELTFGSIGNGQLVIRTKEDVQLENHSIVHAGDELLLELLAAPAYECTKLTVNGEEQPPQNTKLFVTGSLDIRATFSPYTYEIRNGIYINRRTNEVVGCVPEMVKMILDFDQDFGIASNAFLDNKNLQEVDIRQGITSIGAGAFASSKIKKVRLGQCVTTISRNAFAGCQDLLLMELEHTNPNSLKLVSSALAPRKKEGFILRVPNNAVDNFTNHSAFARFKIVPASVAYLLEGDFGTEVQNISIEKCEYWENEGEVFHLPVGTNDLPGGTRISFRNDDALEEKIAALYVNNRRVKLPHTHVLTKSVIFRVRMKEPKKNTDAEDVIQNPVLRISPNPAKQSITVTTTVRTPATYQLLNSYGQVVRTGTFFASEQMHTIGDLPAGLYFLCLHTDGQCLVQRFVKE